MKALHMVAFILTIVGGLNWLLVGILGEDLFSLLGMSMQDIIPKVVYILVGLSAIVLVVTHKKSCRDCSSGSGGQSPMM